MGWFWPAITARAMSSASTAAVSQRAVGQRLLVYSAPWVNEYEDQRNPAASNRRLAPIRPTGIGSACQRPSAAEPMITTIRRLRLALMTLLRIEAVHGPVR